MRTGRTNTSACFFLSVLHSSLIGRRKPCSYHARIVFAHAAAAWVTPPAKAAALVVCRQQTRSAAVWTNTTSGTIAADCRADANPFGCQAVASRYLHREDNNNNKRPSLEQAKQATQQEQEQKHQRVVPDQEWKPMSVKDRVVLFPKSVSMLWKDWLLYQNIQAASKTPRNAWSIQDHYTSRTSEVASHTVHSRIPWRQREQQRRFLNGVSTVLPVVLLWCIPVVGYIPMFVAIAAPRQLLSRHFHNEYETHLFNVLAYRQRHAVFARVQELLFTRLSNYDSKQEFENLVRSVNEKQSTEKDQAGPVFDNLLPMYQSIMGDFGSSSSKPRVSIDTLSRDYLVYLALAVGVYQTLPPQLALKVAQWTPSRLLRRQVRSLAITIADDDNALLLQRDAGFGEPTKRGDDILSTLTHLELMDACLIRGLPVSSDTMTDEMRAMLSNHLRMIASLERRFARSNEEQGTSISETDDPLSMDREAIGLFSMHLAIVRDYFKRKKT